MPFTPAVKNPGDLAKSQEWNDAMTEVVRLENDKVNRSGADTINGPLTISGNVRLGASGTFIQRIIAGRVSSTGAVIAGSGFTCTRLSAGKYRLNFPSPFSALPIVVANCSDLDDDNVVSATPQSNSQVHIAVFDIDPNTNVNPEDASFSFIVIGLA